MNHSKKNPRAHARRICYVALVGSLVLFACSSPPSDSSAGAPAGATPGVEDDSGAPSDETPGSATEGPGPFDLDLTVNETTTTGAAASTLMFVAVRDADTKEMIAFSHDQEKLVGSVAIKEPKSLLRGHRYEIGVKDTWITDCFSSSANVWFHEIPEVTGKVALAVDVRTGKGHDVRGCDVLQASIGLPPGTYATTKPVLGIAGNRVEVTVSPTGRVYTSELRIFCGVTAQCVSTSVSHGACELEQATYPDTTSFSLGDESASHTTVKGTATIDKSKQTIRYTGRTYTWTGSSTMCCDQTFDVTLTKIDSAAACR